MGPLHRQTRGRSAGSGNELAKAGPGQQPGHLPGPKGTSRASRLISLAVVHKYYNKGLKAAEIALAVLIKQLLWLSPPAPVSQVARNGDPADSVHPLPKGGSEDDSGHCLASFSDGLQHSALARLW